MMQWLSGVVQKQGRLRLCWLAVLLLTSPQVVWAQLVDAPKSAGSDEAWPADWYVRDGEGLDELRALEGKPAQELSAAEWRGESTTLAALKGKIVVLDFWATWCGPCMAVIPKNVDFVNQYKDKGVALIGVHDAKSGWDEVDKVISEKGINYPVVLDKTENDNGATTKAYALKFWPTYFIIDREGIVRGAAIKPDKVHEVVDRLLSQSPAPSANMLAGKTLKHPDTWFLGGDKRLKSMRDKEGQRAAQLKVASWISPQPDAADWKGQVRVVQFVRPELSASIDQLTKVQAVADRFARQGVVFVAVCDARSSQKKMQTVIDDKHIELPVALDKSGGDETPIGATAHALGVKFSPSTVVIDRAGKVRAAGLKPDFLDKVLNGLLAEPTPTADESEAEDATAEEASTAEQATIKASTGPAATVASPVAETKTSAAPSLAERPADGAPPAP